MPPHKLCRICRGKSDGLENIFSETNVSGLVSLAFKINYVLGFKVQKDDDRLTVCEVCKAKINDFYDFKIMFEGTEAHFGTNSKLPVIKIKSEPLDEYECNKTSTESSPHKPLSHPLSMGFSNFSNGGVMIPTYYTLDPSGSFIPMPAMMPVGNPIPLSSLKHPSVASLPVLGSFPSSVHSPSAAADSSSESRALPSVSHVKVEAEEPVSDERTKKSNHTTRRSPPILTREKPYAADAVPSTSELPDSESSDDPNTVDDIINEVQTDRDEENSKSSSEDKVETEIEGTNKGDQVTPTAKKQTKNTPNSEALSTRNSPKSGRGGRGSKRRGSSLSAQPPARKSRRAEATPKSTDGAELSRPTTKILTRSSTGCRPRKVRKVVYSDSDDGDFDPDDPDDPEYAAQKKVSSSSSSENEEPVVTVEDKKDAKAKEKQREKEAAMAALIMKSGRIRKEESLMKTCPHCNLTYKHWVSYDTHVKSCEEQKRLEKEKLEREGPKPEQKPEEDDKTEIKCIVCLKIFLGKKALREHMTVHQPKKGPPYECKTCKETFNDKGGLICHVALRHRSNVKEPILKPERKKLHCIDCDEHFQNSGDYICHQVLFHKRK